MGDPQDVFEKHRHLLEQATQSDCRQLWRDWCRRNMSQYDSDGPPVHAELFDTTEHEKKGIEFQAVRTERFGPDERKVLKRNPAMESVLKTELRLGLIYQAFQSDEEPQRFLSRKVKNVEFDWETVEELRRVFTQGAPEDRRAEIMLPSESGHGKTIRIGSNETFDPEGIIYLMYDFDEEGVPIPLYIGKTQLTDSLGYLNHTFNHNSDAKFGRWGYGQTSHLGKLSAVLFDAHFDPGQNYERWADALFVDRTRILNRPVFFSAELYEPRKNFDLETVEQTLIAVASKAYPDELLNAQHRMDDTLSNTTLGQFADD